MTIKDIKIRNAYSVKNNLTFIYHDGEKRKKFVIPNYLWYCIISWEDWKKNERMLKISNLILDVKKDGKFAKLYSDKNEGSPFSKAKTLVKLLKDKKIEIFEADLHSAKRFMVDNEVEVDDQYDILYFDIETDDTLRKIQIGATRILSFGAIDNHGNEFYYDSQDEETEKEMLQKIIKLFYKYDVITGWNSDEFDLPYIFGADKTDDDGNRYHITGRAEYHKLPKFKNYKVARIDMLARARKLFKEDASLKSYSLEAVSQHFLKKGKIKFDGKVIELDAKTLKKYNMHDVYLLKELDEKTGMIDLIAKECAVSKCLIRDFAGVYVSQVLDSMILREAHKEGIYCPSKKYVEEHVDYVGGLVFEPEIGYHKNVYVFDFTSLYPSIILTSNIGFDTIETAKTTHTDTYITNPGTGVKFRKGYQSIIAKVIQRLLDERKEYKKLRLDLIGEGKMESEEYTQARANEIIVKELSNSVYGIMGNQHLRYYQLEVAESITKTGHYLLKFTRDFFNSLEDMNVIYGDTDSVFVACEEEMNVEKVLKKYHQSLQDDLRGFNIDKMYIQLKYEKLFSGMILIGKKYYAGRVVNIEGKKVDEFVAKGIDLVKKATLPMTITAQKEVIEMVLKDFTRKELGDYVETWKQKVLTQEFEFDDIKISTRIGKDIKDYKQVNAPHVKLARAMIAEKGFLETNEIEYVIVDSSAPKDTLDDVALRENYTGEFDRNYYWNNKIWPAIKRILEVYNPGVDWDGEFEIKKPKKSKILLGQQALF